MGIFDEEEKSTTVREIFDIQPVENKNNRKKNVLYVCIAVALVVLLIAGAMVSGIFIGLNSGIAGDLPMMISAYKCIKNYYYEDITWGEFDKLVTSGMISSLDKFSWLNDSLEDNAIVQQLGYRVYTTTYHHHIIAQIIKDMPMADAIAKAKYNSNFEKDNSFSPNDTIVKIQPGDEIYAYSAMNAQPIIIEGADFPSDNSYYSQFNELSLFIKKSDGNGNILDDIYEFKVTKVGVVDKNFAEYYSPEEIGSTNTAMIRFSQFDTSAPEDFDKAITAFLDDPLKPHKLILDLRFNGGGDVTVAQYIAGCLLKDADKIEKPIICLDSKNKNKVKHTIYSTTKQFTNQDGSTIAVKNPYSYYDDFELVVLCNNGSASASEVLIGALSYYDNVEYVGLKTYGKGVAQNTYVYGANPVYSFTLVCGYYYVPSNDENGNLCWTKCIHEVGFDPSEENKMQPGLFQPIENDNYILRAREILET